jgi:serine/threonine protein phosphatase PrpC
MEDAHIAITDLRTVSEHQHEQPMSLFGVFDGHGGVYMCTHERTSMYLDASDTDSLRSQEKRLQSSAQSTLRRS